ncbi:MAG: class I SAM-dependent methyltransferase [Hyphomicrobiales bacterium]|nr:MAG: class I SAM-dependent methyltransferase [Hyphomicrobiales bacterium]
MNNSTIKTNVKAQMTIWFKVIHPITQYFRRGRGDFIRKSFPEIFHSRICDLGGSRHFWEKLGIPVAPRNITIYNISADEAHAIDINASSQIPIIIYDGVHIPVADKHYDLLVCNSVLEHVPPAQRAALAKEMERVSNAVFCQTPAFCFPIEPHFIMPFVHWLPRGIGYQLIKISPWRILSRPSSDTIRSYWWDTKLLSYREVRNLFPNAAITAERVLGITKSYYIVSRPS